MMTRWRRALVVAFLIVAPASGQWLHYPTAGVPRDARGKPNLSAPAPRAADGKPDLSGIWTLGTTCPPEGCVDYPIGPEFGNFGASLRDGLPYQPWAAALVKERAGQNGKEDPTSNCFPGGIVRLHTYPAFNKIIQTPGVIVILSEREVTYRQIFMDGRPLPANPLPTWKGYSIGHWEGDTLVVESTGFRNEGIWLDRKGSPLTDAATITERFRRMNYGRMEVQVTVNDPKAYTAPWTVTLNEFIAPNTELLDFVCLENHK